jgi:hypothetical protein
MILKTGDVGPRWTTGKVLEVTQRLDRDPHLARVFPVLAERRLPDGSTATIRARRIPVALDTPAEDLALAIEAAFRRRLEEFARDVDHLVVRLGFTDEIRRGRISSIVVEARAATVGELERRNAPVLRVRDVRVIFEDVLVNPHSVVTDGRLAPLDVRRVSVERAIITGEALAAFLAGLRRPAVVARLDEGAVVVQFTLPGADVAGRVRVLNTRDGAREPVVEGLRLGGLPVPDFLAAWILPQFDPRPGWRARVRLQVAIGPVTITPQALRIGRP